MKKIYKYIIPISDEQTVKIPYDAKILSAQMQNGQLCLWAIVDPKSDVQGGKVISIHGTGHELRESPGQLKFISTVQDGPLVWHVFERIDAFY